MLVVLCNHAFKNCFTAAVREKWEKCETDMKVREERGKRSARAEILWRRPWWNRLSPCSPWSNTWEHILSVGSGWSGVHYPIAALAELCCMWVPRKALISHLCVGWAPAQSLQCSPSPAGWGWARSWERSRQDSWPKLSKGIFHLMSAQQQKPKERKRMGPLLFPHVKLDLSSHHVDFPSCFLLLSFWGMKGYKR